MVRPGEGDTAPYARWAARLGIWWPRHRFAFAIVVGCATVADVFFGEGWNTFAPVLVWTMAFGLHYIVTQSLTMDEEQAERRTENLRLRAYDQGHIDDIGGRHDVLIDAHHHLWDLDRNYHPWLCDDPPVEGRHGDYRAIRRSYLTEDFRRDWDGLPVVGSVYVEAEWDPSDPAGETAWAASVAEETGFPTVIVAQAWLRRGDVEEVLARQAGFERVRGVREKPAVAAHPNEVVPYAPGSMSDPAWQEGYAKLETHGLSFDLQAPFWHLPEARALAERFPGITIILDHCGLPSLRTPEGLAAWRKCMRTLAEAPNTAVKISGLGEPQLPGWSVRTHRDVVLETIDIFGVDRCMFASNYPVDRLYAPYGTILRGFQAMVGRFSLAERRRMFCENAMRWYRIDPESLAEPPPPPVEEFVEKRAVDARRG
ncbi:MAG: amidohydrolase family protein [Immundisolibacterales bacterium]|nr:amidohydrolase family protein [Immundisolibacterales bacterium]